MSEQLEREAVARIKTDMGIPYVKSEPVMDLRKRAAALCKTLVSLQAYGMELPEPDDDAEDVAETLVHAYAQDPYETSKEASADNCGTLTPSALLLVHETLETFAKQTVVDANRIRHLVTNKLIIESENADPRVRLKALELLGKISDVGLFTEKRHITVEDKTRDEIRSSLRTKLETLRNQAIEAEFEEVPDTDERSGPAEH